jgi:putative transposase
MACFQSVGYLLPMSSKGWHSRGYLPHLDTGDVVQFVTFRLADSLPKEAVERLRFLAQAEARRDEMLDQGWGACWLASEDIAGIVEDAFLTFDDDRYRLCAWTVMPNHVHVLFKLLAPHGLGAVAGSWKRFTARAANRRLGRSGAFWQDDYWDRFVRHDAHYAAAVAYIDQNPVKAGLVAAPEDWPWGSARFQH